MEPIWLWISYLIGSISFVLGLKFLSHPETARRGNWLAAAGMTLAIAATLFLYRNAEGKPLQNYGWIFAGLALGTLIGWVAAKRVKMTAMPQMVSLFNGMGGACAAVISLMEYPHHDFAEGSLGRAAIILAGLLIGGTSFAGSMIAFGKLNGNIGDKIFRGQLFVNMIVLAVVLLLAILLTVQRTPNMPLLLILTALVLLYGVLFVLPIGGADMPVVISLLNSFTGVAAACGGFIYSNQVMLTGGILVGSAGTILTILMCRAMNRSLANVLLGNFAASNQRQAAGAKGVVKEISLSDAATLLSYSRKVMVVPGYGLAVAQAQHTMHELESLLEERGVEVTYAIHPVAGRMPGHMNVLLAEADVPYDKLLEMDQANDAFSQTDAVLVVGANDVVNPAAKTDPTSPIYGMPILDVLQAKHVIVIKRSMNTGYAGIENDLFYADRTRMLFGDAKTALQKLVAEISAN